MPRHRRSSVVSAIFAAMICVPAGGRAGETILDPANESAEETGGAASASASEDSGETIRDPANDPDESSAAEASAEASDEERSGLESDVDVRGDYATALAIDTDWGPPEEDVVEYDSAVGIALGADFAPSTRVEIAAYAAYWTAGKRVRGGPTYLFNARAPRASFEPRLGESYVRHRTDRWQVRAGYLLVPWGRTDLVRPGNVINPLSATGSRSAAQVGSGMYRPRFGVEGGYVAPNWAVEVVLMPFFAPDRSPLFGRDTALARWGDAGGSRDRALEGLVGRFFDPSRFDDVQDALRAESEPDERPRNASVGVRVTGTVENTDLGAGYFVGWDGTPSFSVDPDLRRVLRAGAGEPAPSDGGDGRVSVGDGDAVSSTYRRRHTLLLDAARYVGPIGLRLDLTFSPERTFVTRRLETVRRPTFFGALGLSYERVIDGDALAVTAEGFWMHPFARGAAPTRWFVSDGERGERDARLAYVGPELYGVAAAVDWELPVADLELSLGGLSDLSAPDLLLDAELARRWKSWLRTGVGFRLYTGPPPDRELSVGGVYDRNDQVVISVDGSF